MQLEKRIGWWEQEVGRSGSERANVHTHTVFTDMRSVEGGTGTRVVSYVAISIAEN